MGKISVIAKGAGKIVNIPFSIIEEVLSTKNNVDRIHHHSARTLQYFQQIDKKLYSLQEYIDKNEYAMNQEEKDLTLQTMLYLFIERRGELESAMEALNKMQGTFLKDRVMRSLI